MDNEFRVAAIKSRLNIAGRFQQTPKYEVQLSREVSNKLGSIHRAFNKYADPCSVKAYLSFRRKRKSRRLIFLSISVDCNQLPIIRFQKLGSVSLRIRSASASSILNQETGLLSRSIFTRITPLPAAMTNVRAISP